MTIVEIFRDGGASDFHGRDWPVVVETDEPDAHLWWFQPSRSALVLGSTQDFAVVDTEECAARGIDIVRRRSGGGAVLLQPGNTLWIDVVLPSHHLLWRNDIGEAALWIGDTCATTLMELGCENLMVHRGPMLRSDWSNLVCFAGRGSGEVFDADGSKVVGISQRRTRHWARFQCVVSIKWDPETLCQVLRPPRPSVSEIADAGSSLSVDATTAGTAIIEALTAVLDRR
jgi:lipoate-protein ligase A